ncbi:hypothetical protein DAKH74_037550 [Maudiozyma humilis]|uniref:Uncharacterized protein n=1 Tax=Maudiozyma humilis TaxID=51915 RepID=A0AAV5S391_MAUHU|nr:hypothetical protein DAKH74_037550 [Kazachstania humilis]
MPETTSNTPSQNSASAAPEQRLPETVELHRGGKTKVVNLEQLKKPHAVTSSPEFIRNHPVQHAQSPDGSNAGGLLQTGGHRPSQGK